MDTRYPTLNLCVRTHAEQSPDKTAYTFLDDAGQRSEHLSYAQLDSRARLIAEEIRTHAGGQEQPRVLLLFWPGLDFTVALHGCLYAGAIAVPAYPPEPSRVERTLARLKAIATDAAPAIVLTNSMLKGMAEPLLVFAPDLAQLPWLAVDELCQNPVIPAYRDPELTPQDLALIQYTSGSTSIPKGVMVSHHNILANMEMIESRACQGADSVFVSWLPTYHDLGLMGGVFLPALVGGSSVLMSPLDFLRRPASWLETISRYRATNTFVPNFALDIAVRKIVGCEREALDLSCLKYCIVGAEPVRHESIERFIEAFEPQGLASSSMVPGYGLAETVVAVSGGPEGETPRSLFVDKQALADNRIMMVPPSDHEAVPLVSSGRPLPSVQVEIVDPQTCQLVAPGEVGEVWVRGSNVAHGYWQRDDDTEATFKACLDQHEAVPWLRTGDLGCLESGHLYITGRIKDLIILRGKNHYPQDLELSAERSHSGIRPGAVIAFTCEQEDAEQRLVIIAEIASHLPQKQDQLVFAAMAEAIRGALSEQHALLVHDIVLIKAGSIDKTSSGKLARQACKRRYLKDKLETLFTWNLGATLVTPTETASASISTATSTTAPASESHHTGWHTLDADARRQLLRDDITQAISRLTGNGDHALLAPDARLSQVGLDSLAGMDLAVHIEQQFGVSLPLMALLSSTTLGDLIARVEQTGIHGNKKNKGWQWQDDATAPLHAASDATCVATLPGGCAVALSDWKVDAPLFCVPGLTGMPAYLSSLAPAFGTSRPLVAFQAPGADGLEHPLGSVEELASRYIDEMKAIQPEGPYTLAGHSFGGLVAYEMAQRLSEQGASVHVLLLDTLTPSENDETSDASDEVMALFELCHVNRRFTGDASPVPGLEKLDTLSLEQQREILARELGVESTTVATRLAAIYKASYAAMESYRPRPYAGPVTLFRARSSFPEQVLHPARKLMLWCGNKTLGWEPFCPSLKVVKVPGDHFTMVLPSHATELVTAMQEAISDRPRMHLGLERLAAAHIPHREGRPLDISAQALTLDPYHPVHIEDPYPILRQVRTQTPAIRDIMSRWWITRHADVSAGMRDKRFSVDPRSLQGIEHTFAKNSNISLPMLSASSRQQQDKAFNSLLNNFMLFLDPPRHQYLRRVFTPLFTPEAVQHWAHFIDARAEELIGNLKAHPAPDLVRDLALPLPVAVISGMLGLPQEDIPLLLPWAQDLIRSFDPLLSDEITRRIDQSAADFTRYLREHLETLRRTSAVANEYTLSPCAALDQGLSLEELIAQYAIIFAVGFETTTDMIGNSTLALLRNPDQLERWRRHPELTENAVEELLRYDGAVRCSMRYALDDVELGGQQIQRGDTVVFSFSAANRDPQAFPNPERLDIGRNAGKHVAFAHGAHYCLGAYLARLELRRVLPALIRHDFALAPEGVQWRDSMVFRGMEQLRINFL
ncbi:cytochrome P450 [Halomonas binhaiensis]|uniref:Cytochrome P450 n=1 Tax=Halomonas binhaiensis TaxID=2562282 RepID=A0A856QK29_9GAMM|nr:cytochrome P450 [Halomonas binhaiensis]QEM80265.2 cytochrome P450 [Halomonas binhaiensis]